MSTLAEINGYQVERLALHASQVGRWTAVATLVDAQNLTGVVTITLGQRAFVGTVVEAHSGESVLQRTVTIVGGYGGWDRYLPAKPYHSDDGVSTRLVIADAAADAGEKLGTVQPMAIRFSGRDYLRASSVPASRALEDASRGVQWWVGSNGLTYVGLRPTARCNPDQYSVVEYDPQQRVVRLSMLDLGDLTVGSVLLSPLFDADLTVRELELEVTDTLSVWCWCGGDASSEGRLLGLLNALTRRQQQDKLYGTYRYRALKMEGDGRVQCQAVRREPGLPDTLPISMWSAPGIHAELTLGVEVMVSFEAGDRSAPYISGLAPKAFSGHVPQQLELAGDDVGIARIGDTVSSAGPGTIVTFDTNPPPPDSPPPTPLPMMTRTPYLVSYDATPPKLSPPTAAKLVGTITSGSTIVLTKGDLL